MTDSEEDGLTFDGCAFEAILKGSQRAGVTGPARTVGTQVLGAIARHRLQV